MPHDETQNSEGQGCDDRGDHEGTGSKGGVCGYLYVGDGSETRYVVTGVFKIEEEELKK